MRSCSLLLALAAAACGPARPASDGSVINAGEVVLSLENEPAPPPVPPAGKASGERYGYSFETDDPLTAGPAGPPPGNVDPSRVPPAPQWKCRPGSTCEIRDALELHKDLFAPCRAAARLDDPIAPLRFVAHATLNRDGAVSAVDIRDLAPRSRAVEACVTRAFQQIPFPLQVDVESVALTVPVRVVRETGKPPR